MQRRYVFFPRVRAPKRKREKSIFAARDDTLFQPRSKLRLDLPANLRSSRDRQVPANKCILQKQLVPGKYIWSSENPTFSRKPLRRIAFRLSVRETETRNSASRSGTNECFEDRRYLDAPRLSYTDARIRGCISIYRLLPISAYRARIKNVPRCVQQISSNLCSNHHRDVKNDQSFECSTIISTGNLDVHFFRFISSARTLYVFALLRTKSYF